MTPSPTSEPELEAKPVPITDPPGAATDDTVPVDATVVAGDTTVLAAESTATTPTETAQTETESAETTPLATEVLAASDADDDDSDLAEDAEDEDAHADPAPRPGFSLPPLGPLVGAIAGLTALIAVLLTAFALPAVHSGPNRLPIGVSGTPAITAQLKTLFTANGSKAFTVTVYAQETALRTAIKHRQVYGGLSITSSGATMLVSSAASPIAAEALGSIAGSLGSQNQTQIAVSDVVPLPTKDPRGYGLIALGLPLAIGSLLPALLMFELYRRRAAIQVGAALAASVLIGFAVSAILTFWVGATHGANFWLLSLGLAGGLAATSLILLGLGAIGGRIGLAIGSAVILLIAAPLSGFATAPEWLPSPWGTIGQLLPSGAASTLLRSTAFFDGHGSGSSLLILAAWALIGLLLLILGTALLKPFEPTPESAEPLPAG